MQKRKVICPYCRHSFMPFGVFMLEKIFCPSCGRYFLVLKYASVIRIVYSAMVFLGIAFMYRKYRPQASVVIAVFWVVALVVIKVLTYIVHKIMYFLWSKRDV